MMTIRELESVNSEYITNIAKLHKKAFPNFFLSQLGIPFLKTLYYGYMEDIYSGIIVAEEGDNLVGFIAYSKDYPNFFKGLIKKHLIKFAICSVWSTICHPSFVKRLLSAFKKSDSVVKEVKYVELASICVDPEKKNLGIGTKLITYLKNAVDYSQYSFINLETDAENNDAVNKFYVKNGFELCQQFTTKEGRKMNEYHYRK